MTGSGQTWLEFRVQVASEFASRLESLMASLGALSITLTDLADTPVLEPGVGETPLWPDLFVTGLFESQADAAQLKSILCRAPGVFSDQQVGLSTLDDRDWERVWMEDFGPMQFGRDLWIMPGQQQAPEPGATVIELDPGLAFGSGSHPTTRLCLEWIDAQTFQGATVIDFGCGSGVLGIAAALKGAVTVMCVDNDPQALLATNENAARNHVGSNIVTSDGTQFAPGSGPGNIADVMLANILAGTLVKLAPVLCSALKPGGLIALSGILDEQAEEVIGVYKQWLEDMKQSDLEGWVLISGKRKELDK